MSLSDSSLHEQECSRPLQPVSPAACQQNGRLRTIGLWPFFAAPQRGRAVQPPVRSGQLARNVAAPPPLLGPFSPNAKHVVQPSRSATHASTVSDQLTKTPEIEKSFSFPS